MKFKMLGVVLGLFGLVSCAGHPVNTAPLSQSFAKYGYDALSGVEILENATSSAESQGLVKTAAAAEVMKGSYKAGIVGQKLAAALKEFDKLSAQAQATPLQQAPILALVKDFEAALHDVAGVNVGPNFQTQIAQLVVNVFTVISTLKASLTAIQSTQVMQPTITVAALQTGGVR